MTVLSPLAPELTPTILESVRHGFSLRQAALAAGVSNGTVGNWMQIASGATTWADGSPIAPETRDGILSLLEQASRAQAEGMTILGASLWHNATTISEKTGWFDTQATDKLLSKGDGFRKHWHEEKHVVQEGSVNHNHVLTRMQALPDDELYALADGESPSPAANLATNTDD